MKRNAPFDAPEIPTKDRLSNAAGVGIAAGTVSGLLGYDWKQTLAVVTIAYGVIKLLSMLCLCNTG